MPQRARAGNVYVQLRKADSEDCIVKSIALLCAAGTLVFGAVSPARAQQAADAADSPLSLDRTGLNWVLPFEKARTTAGENNRLLMIKPVAFGTSLDGGW